MIVASIILAGGASSRMGYPKAWLPFGATTVLARIVKVMADVTNPVVVVAAGEEQDLPPLPAEIAVVYDARPGKGPLEGMAAGMRAVRGLADAAYVTSCDAPFVTGRLVSGLADLLGQHEAAVPFVEGRFEPLAGIYRLSVLPRLEELLAGKEPGVQQLLERVDARRVAAAEIRALDPDLRVLTRMNTPQEYSRALELAGLPAALPPFGRHPAAREPS